MRLLNRGQGPAQADQPKGRLARRVICWAGLFSLIHHGFKVTVKISDVVDEKGGFVTALRALKDRWGSWPKYSLSSENGREPSQFDKIDVPGSDD